MNHFKNVTLFVFQVDLRVIVTDSSLHFFDHKSLPVQVYTDQDEWVCVFVCELQHQLWSFD